jgi:hypothetical protein
MPAGDQLVEGPRLTELAAHDQELVRYPVLRKVVLFV